MSTPRKRKPTTATAGATPLTLPFEVDATAQPPLGMPAADFLRDYWQTNRGAREMPARRDIRPADLKKYLDSIVMIDVLGDGDFRYRLVGTTITRYFRVDPTGKRVAEAWAPAGEDAVRRVTTNLAAVVAGRVPMRLWGQIDWTGIPEDFDALYLPLSEDGQTVNMILSGFTFDQSAVLKATGDPTDAT